MRRPARIQAAAAATSARIQAAGGAPQGDPDVSLDDYVSRVRDALYARSRSQLNGVEWWAEKVYPDHVIARHGTKVFKVLYTMDAEGNVTWGESQEMEEKFVPVEVAVSASTVHARLAAAAAGAEPTGLEWEVVVIEEGMSAAAATLPNGQQLPVLFTSEYLDTLAPLLEGCRVYALDDTATGHKPTPAEKRQEQLAGFLTNVRRVGTQILATLSFNPTGAGAAKGLDLANAWKKKVTNLFGLSIDAAGTGEIVKQGARQVWKALQAKVCDSVDVVVRPGAGGRFTKLLASATAAEHTNTTHGGAMKKQALLFAWLKAHRPAAVTNLDAATATLDELMDVATAAEIAAAFADPAPVATPAAAAAATGTAVMTAADVTAQVNAHVTAALQLRGAKEAIITASRLPEKALAGIRPLLDDPSATAAQVQASVDTMREILADAVATPVYGMGGVRTSAALDIRVGATPLDKLQAGLDRAFGLVPADPTLSTIQALGLRQLYNELTLGLDESVHGVFGPDQMGRIHAAGFNEDTLASLLLNTMNRRVVNDYGQPDYGAQFLVSTEGPKKDFKPQEAVRWGYFGDLAVVDTDVEDYPEQAAYGEEKAYYSLEERGRILHISRRHIINDDLGHIAKIPEKFMRAGRRTVARYIFNFAIANPVITLTPGTLTWAHATRNNLITLALGIPGLNAADTALYNQTEPDSAEKLGLRIVHLYVPQALELTAKTINQSQYDPAYPGEQRANPWYHYFGEKNENIHTVPFMTDPTDWFVTADPKEVEIIEMGYLNGIKVPQIVRADAAGVGAMFSRGRISVKAFFDFAGTPVDHRGWVKSVVA